MIACRPTFREKAMFCAELARGRGNHQHPRRRTPGQLAARLKACIPPIDPPTTAWRRRIPSPSSSATSPRTMSRMVMTGKTPSHRVCRRWQDWQGRSTPCTIRSHWRRSRNGGLCRSACPGPTIRSHQPGLPVIGMRAGEKLVAGQRMAHQHRRCFCPAQGCHRFRRQSARPRAPGHCRAAEGEGWHKRVRGSTTSRLTKERAVLRCFDWLSTQHERKNFEDGPITLRPELVEGLFFFIRGCDEHQTQPQASGQALDRPVSALFVPGKFQVGGAAQPFGQALGHSENPLSARARALAGLNRRRLIIAGRY